MLLGCRSNSVGRCWRGVRERQNVGRDTHHQHTLRIHRFSTHIEGRLPHETETMTKKYLSLSGPLKDHKSLLWGYRKEAWFMKDVIGTLLSRGRRNNCLFWRAGIRKQHLVNFNSFTPHLQVSRIQVSFYRFPKFTPLPSVAACWFGQPLRILSFSSRLMPPSYILLRIPSTGCLSEISYQYEWQTECSWWFWIPLGRIWFLWSNSPKVIDAFLEHGWPSA